MNKFSFHNGSSWSLIPSVTFVKGRGLAAEFYMQGLRELVDPGAKDLLKPRGFTGVSQGTCLTAMIPKRILMNFVNYGTQYLTNLQWGLDYQKK